jgi:hypothetical protein
MHLPDPNQSKILCCKRVYLARWYEDMCNTIECVLHLGMSDRTTQCRKARRGQCPEDAPSSTSRVHDLFHVWVVGLQESFIGRFQRRQFLELLVGVHPLVLRQSLKTLCLCLNRNKGFLRNLANLCSTWPMHAHHVSIRSYSYKLIGTLSIIQDIDLHDMCNCACAFIRDIDRNDMCKCVCVCAYMSEACIVNKDASQVPRRWAGIHLCVFFSVFQVEMSLMTVFSSVLKSCKDALQSLSQASVHCLASNNFRSAGFIFPRFVSSAWCHICVYVLERPMQFN